MTALKVPTRQEVTPENQAIFDKLEKSLGFVPNIYAAMAHSPNALGHFLAAGSRKSSLSTKEKEVINLIVSQSNNCSYCLAAHTAISKMNGFTDEQVIDIRKGDSIGDTKLDSLAAFVRSAVQNSSKPSTAAHTNLVAEGYNEENIVDIVLAISEITATNYLHGISQVPVDFPAAATLREAVAV